jgi:tetratricopeptide (TPR) repeat protein
MKDPSQDPNMIKIYDKYGREGYISKDEWRKNVLPGLIRENWDKPDDLYNALAMTVRDGFGADVVDAAQRLYAIDKNRERSACMLAVVFVEAGKLDDAERVLTEYINEYGPSGVILNNLAVVWSKRGIYEEAERILLESLKLDPNLKSTVEWWWAIHYERGGKEGCLRAMQEIAGIQGSWRPQLWIARNYLEQGNAPEALRLYRDVIPIASNEPETLMMISGDLGNNGYISEIIELISPVYDPEKHGLATGFNLLNAYLQTEDYEDGLKLLDRLFKLNRFDIRQTLLDFSDKFEELRGRNELIRVKAPLEAGGTMISWPIWYYKLEDPKWLIKDKPPDSPIVWILPLANTTHEFVEEIISQREDELGRLTRSIPLYILERLYLETSWSPSVCIPIERQSGGFIVHRADYDPEQIKDLVNVEDAPIFLLSGEINQTEDKYNLVIRLWEPVGGQLITIFEMTGSLLSLEGGLEGVITSLKEWLLSWAGSPQKPPFFYGHPLANALNPYLAALGQSLVLTVADSGILKEGSIFGERNILNWFLNLALTYPSFQVAKIMFISGLRKNQLYGSEIYKEYRSRMLALIEDEKDSNSALYWLAPLCYKIFDMHTELSLRRDELLQMGCSKEYQEWLNRL